MVDKLDLDRLRALVEAASQLPWVYRPDKYDDWGWIRGVERDDRDIGPFRPIVANAKDGLVRDEDMDAHRRAGTDPYGPNAELIVAAVNLIPTLLANATPANGEQVERAKAIWKRACIGREGYCSSDLQDAAIEAINQAFREAEAAARSAALPAHYQWSESNREKFEFGRDTAADLIATLSTPTEDARERVKVLEEARSEDHAAAYDLAEAMDGRTAGECLASVFPQAFARHRRKRVEELEQALGNLLDFIGPKDMRFYATDLVVVEARTALGNKETDRHG